MRQRDKGLMFNDRCLYCPWYDDLYESVVIFFIQRNILPRN